MTTPATIDTNDPDYPILDFLHTTLDDTRQTDSVRLDVAAALRAYYAKKATTYAAPNAANIAAQNVVRESVRAIAVSAATITDRIRAAQLVLL